MVDFANPFHVMGVMLIHAGAAQSGFARFRTVLAVVAGGKKAGELNFRTACEVAGILAKRLGLGDAVLAALGSSLAAWDGRGLPRGVQVDGIPRPMPLAPR